MKIYQSLTEASLYRAVALIPEQIMFGFALASDIELREQEETKQAIKLGREFCIVFESLIDSERKGTYKPRTAIEATIASGIQLIPTTDLEGWRDRMTKVRIVVDQLEKAEHVELDRLREAGLVLEGFASFAKRRLSTIGESDLRFARA